jgi:hypothetical protein
MKNCLENLYVSREMCGRVLASVVASMICPESFKSPVTFQTEQTRIPLMLGIVTKMIETSSGDDCHFTISRGFMM